MAVPHWLVVGLGNPGREYAGNRHNIGFMALDAAARRHDLGPFRSRFHAEVAPGRIGDVEVLALKPTTFMNNSGRAVATAARFFKLPGSRILVCHDELDLAEGKVRVKRGGGAAGHNGLRSIDAYLGPDYWRLRLGIGHPGDKGRVLGHVLNDFARADTAWLEPMLAAVAEHIGLILQGDPPAFMSKVALATQPPKVRPGDQPASGGQSGEDERGV
jgi:PTH1 family peptidyl-tRNA hydrolase